MDSRRRRGAVDRGRHGEFRSGHVYDRGGESPTEEAKEVFATMHRYQGVLGVIATLSNGMVIMSTMPDKDDTNRYARMAAGLGSDCRSSIGAGRKEQLNYFTVKDGNHEIVVTPGRLYTIIVVKKQQEPLEEASQ
ncbi:dynein light chain roadblock-type 1-like [Rhipicephalus microplus]|uniref:dynein light chain roadblock-type 1-like n=1 Tax=Rhipicephalus microplus TaxID=6941 RepID=UPI0023766BF9